MSTITHTLASQRQVGDALLTGVVWFLFAYSLGLAGWHHTWFEALALGLPLATVTTIVTLFFRGTVLSRNVIAVSFMLFAALTIHQAQGMIRSEEHTSELQSRGHLVCRLLLEKKTQVSSRRYR